MLSIAIHDPLDLLLVSFAILIYVFACGIKDLASLFRRNRNPFPKSDAQYYAQFEPNPQTACLLACVALLLYIVAWLTGAFASPMSTPATGTLIADIIFTVCGFACCVYARWSSASRLQTGLTWMPFMVWTLHAIILFGHGIHFN